MQSYKQPTPEEVQAAFALIESRQYAEYFLERLQNPLWIAPLRERGSFNDPPATIREGDSHLAYRWPESEYLARMASIAPQQVTEIFKSLKTDNWRILHDILMAAKAMPANFAAELVPVIADGHDQGLNFYGLNDIAELIEKLAKDVQPDAAVDLMRRTMKLEWKNKRHRDSHWYIDGLSTHVVPALASVRTNELIEHLTSELKTAIKSDPLRSRNREDDYSYVWRPAIEDDEQNHGYDTRDDLVGCLRDAYELAIRGKSLKLKGAFKLLEKEKLLIFRRLKLHLIRLFGDDKLIRSTIMDRSLFDDSHIRHEYAVMVRDHYKHLDPAQQTTWLGWVDAGPDDLRSGDEELRKRQSDYWKFEKLSLIRDDLKPPLSTFVERMLEEHGEPELALYPSYSRSAFVADQSPFSVEEMQSEGFARVVQMVAEWRPAPDARRYENPTLEGLRRTFNQYVATDPSTFSKQAALLKGKPAPFVRAFLEAILQGFKEKKPIDVSAVLELSEWVVAQPLYDKSWPTEEGDRLYDHDWQWAWNSVADVWEVLCEPNTPIKLRYRVWYVIEKILGGGSESGCAIDDDGKDIRSTDFINHAINSAQGKVMEALIAYTRWVAKALEVERDGKKVFEGGFDKLLEVRKALDDKLKPENSSFASRSMYGWHFNLLHWIDRQWVAANVATIFDLKQFERDPETAYGWAAWNCFLLARNPRFEYYDLLKEQYSYGVDQVAEAKFEDTPRFKPFGRLGEHLMILYGLGHIELDSEDHIIYRFIERSPVALRSATIEFIGHAVGSTDDLEPEVIERYKTLWTWYWNKLGQSDAENEPDSSVFGAWFVSGKFDNQWSLERLDEFTQLVPKARPERSAVKRLAEVASTDIHRSTKILGRLIDGDKEGWRIYGWRDEAMKILALALAASGETEILAEGIIDKLGRRRFTEFGKLLKLPNRIEEKGSGE